MCVGMYASVINWPTAGNSVSGFCASIDIINLPVLWNLQNWTHRRTDGQRERETDSCQSNASFGHYVCDFQIV